LPDPIDQLIDLLSRRPGIRLVAGVERRAITDEHDRLRPSPNRRTQHPTPRVGVNAKTRRRPRWLRSAPRDHIQGSGHHPGSPLLDIPTPDSTDETLEARQYHLQGNTPSESIIGRSLEHRLEHPVPLRPTRSVSQLRRRYQFVP